MQIRATPFLLALAMVLVITMAASLQIPGSMQTGPVILTVVDRDAIFIGESGPVSVATAVVELRNLVTARGQNTPVTLRFPKKLPLSTYNQLLFATREVGFRNVSVEESGDP